MRFITRFRFCARSSFWTLLAMLWLPLVGLRGQTPSEPRKTDTVMQSSAKPTLTGITLFKMRCAKCHDAQGKGTAARASLPEIPDFTSAWWQKKRTIAQLTVAILDGKGSKMPAFADRITKEEARELAVYIRTLGPAQAADEVAPAADDFQKRFDELKKEFQRLRKQFEELNGTAKKQRTPEGRHNPLSTVVQRPGTCHLLMPQVMCLAASSR
jgi:mono/diheme cytochrome c family protein